MKSSAAISYNTDSLLRIVLDARKVFDGGIGAYIRNLVDGLLQLRNQGRAAFELTLLVSRETYCTKEWQDLKWQHETNVILTGPGGYSVKDYLFLAKAIPWDSVDVFHTPHYTLPFNIPVPVVVTVHDVIHLSHPEHWFYPFIAKPLIASALKRAAKIITVSETSHKAITDSFRNVPEVTVIENAVQPFFFKNNGNCEVLLVNSPFVLVVASTDKPHKGVDDAIAAYRGVATKLLQEKRSVPALVITGHGARPRPYDGPGEVVFAGVIPLDSLKALYGSAECILIPSLVEGSSMPALEAHAQGTRAVARPIAAVKELLFSEFDLIAADFSVESLSAELYRALVSPLSAAEKAKLSDCVRSRHSCETAALKTLALYSSLRGAGK